MKIGTSSSVSSKLRPGTSVRTMMKASTVPIGTAITVMPAATASVVQSARQKSGSSKHEPVGVERELARRREERVAEEALVDHQQDRAQHQHDRDARSPARRKAAAPRPARRLGRPVRGGHLPPLDALRDQPTLHRRFATS